MIHKTVGTLLMLLMTAAGTSLLKGEPFSKNPPLPAALITDQGKEFSEKASAASSESTASKTQLSETQKADTDPFDTAIPCPNFDKICLSMDGNYTLKFGEKPSVRFLNRPELRSRLHAQVDQDHMLHVQGVQIHPSQLKNEPLNIEITLPYQSTQLTREGQTVYVTDWNQLLLQAAGKVNLPCTFKTPQFSILGQQPSQIQIHRIETESLTLHLSNGAQCTFKEGYATEQCVRLTGRSQYAATHLMCDRAQVEVYDLAQARLYVKNDMKTLIRGTGQIHYLGNPRIQGNTDMGRILKLSETSNTFYLD